MPLHRGKIATPPDIVSIRPLTREDLVLIDQKRDPLRSGGSAVARFRDPHHRIARLFASGLRGTEVQAQTGFSYNRLSALRNDPAFQQLIAVYRNKIDERFAEGQDEFYETATANMRKAERMIAEQLEEADENDVHLPIKTLDAIAAGRMDRFGYGKRETRLNVNMDFAAQLEGAIARSGKAKVIEATAPQLLPQSAPGVHSPLPESSEQPSSPPVERRVLRRA